MYKINSKNTGIYNFNIPSKQKKIKTNKFQLNYLKFKIS